MEQIMKEKEKETKKSLTILRNAGLISPELLDAVNRIVQKYKLTFYLSTAQNIRLLEVRDEDRQAIMDELIPLGVKFKGEIKYPLAKVCVSAPHCSYGKIDTFGLEKKISSMLSEIAPIKPKIKIAISGCPMACSGPMTVDIGIVGTPRGMDVFVGGKLGAIPKSGRRIARKIDEEQVLTIIKNLAVYHNSNTPKKQRMFRLIDKPDFPYP